MLLKIIEKILTNVKKFFIVTEEDLEFRELCLAVTHLDRMHEKKLPVIHTSYGQYKYNKEAKQWIKIKTTN